MPLSPLLPYRPFQEADLHNRWWSVFVRGAEKIGEGLGEESVAMTSPVGIVRQVHIRDPCGDRFGEDFVGTRNWERRIFSDFSDEVHCGILRVLEIRRVGRGFVGSNKENKLGDAIALDDFLKNRNSAAEVTEVRFLEVFFSRFVEVDKKIAVVRRAEETRLGKRNLQHLVV